MSFIEMCTLLGSIGELTDFPSDNMVNDWTQTGVILKIEDISYIVNYLEKDDQMRCQRAMVMKNGHMYFFSLSSYPVMRIYATERCVLDEASKDKQMIIEWLLRAHTSFKEWFNGRFMPSEKHVELLEEAKEYKQPIIYVKKDYDIEHKSFVMDFRESDVVNKDKYQADFLFKVMMRKWKNEGFML